MPDFDKLLEIYRKWPEGKLLDEYSKKSEYPATAIRAMEQVLQEQGLLEDIKDGGLASLIEKDQEAANLAEQAWIEDRPQRVFHEEYLPPDHKGVYANGTLLNMTRERLGNKGEISIYQEGKSVIIELNHGPYVERIESPFEVLFYGTKTVERTNFFKTSEWYVLHVLIKAPSGEWVSLQEKQKNFKKLPEGWTLLAHNDPRLSPPHIFEYFDREVRLLDLKKLLDEHKA